MNYEVRYSDTFKRSVKSLAKKYLSIKNDLIDFVKELFEKPDMGTPLGNNIYKVINRRTIVIVN